MILAAAALLVLAGLGLFVGGLLTGATALYWACVAVCLVAACLIALAARQQRLLATSSAPPAVDPERPVEDAAAAAVPVRRAASGGLSAPAGATATSVSSTLPAREEDGEPPVEEVEVTDLLLVVDLRDEVLVIDEHPRYHVPGCPRLGGATPIPLPLDEARTDGFTPCGVCRPEATLADRVRARTDPAGS